MSAEYSLLIGFDAAWSEKNQGHIICLHQDHRGLSYVHDQRVSLNEALHLILTWSQQSGLIAKISLYIDMPTIVNNESGQRPVEKILSSPISKLGGGMQSSNRKKPYFGDGATIWAFLNSLTQQIPTIQVYETYPAASLIGLNWLSPESDRSLKYNPSSGKKFRQTDWTHLCVLTAKVCEDHSLHTPATILRDLAGKEKPRKADQDFLDAVLCLAPALGGQGYLTVGQGNSGKITIAFGKGLEKMILQRLAILGWSEAEWLQKRSPEPT